jgi:hypothetical protein
MPARAFSLATIGLAGCLLTMAPSLAASPRQGLTGVQANWKDLETWSHLLETSRENELGVGLQPEGGAVIAFLGRLSIRDPKTPPAEVRAQLAAAYLANPNRIRTRTLTFIADAGTPRRFALDASDSLITDDGSPGGIIQNAIGTIRGFDFLRLASANALSANILGFEVVFRPEQLRAMRGFADRIRLGAR